MEKIWLVQYILIQLIFPCDNVLNKLSSLIASKTIYSQTLVAQIRLSPTAWIARTHLSVSAISLYILCRLEQVF